MTAEHMDATADAGLSEIARFLAMRAPFDALAPQELGEVVAETQLEFYPAGAVILSEDGGPVTFLRVIHSGGVDITHEGKLLDLLGPGDSLGHAAMLSGLPPGFDARAQEDTLCYRIPVAVARPLLDRAQSRELRTGMHEPGHQLVVNLIRSPTVRCEPMQSIREVAHRMTDAGANAAVVDLRGGRFGIVTDRDIRTKVVAKGLPITAPVATAMTSEVFTVTPDSLGGEVLFELLERGIGHAPVVSERGELIGVVEAADLFAAQPRSWFGVRRSIARAHSVDALAAVAPRIPEIVTALHAANLRASEVARVLSALTDAITIRALELASIGVRLPPDGLVWVAVGSQARREMTPASKPGGAIVHSEPAAPEWIDAVRAALRRCDLIGQVISRTPRDWAAPGKADELALTVLVERRALWGTPREPLPTVREGDSDGVLAALARRALAYSPPTGFDADAVLEADGTRRDRLDIRRAAVIPIVEIGRWAGAVAGAVDGSTPERLRRAAAARVLNDGDARTLTDAFELALELRIGHHMTQLAAGHKPDDSIEIVAISPLMRDHLRDVFRAVSSVQRGLRS
jgi:CBS domain-containing protein